MTDFYDSALFRAPDAATYRAHVKHFRKAYEAAGLDVPGRLTDDLGSLRTYSLGRADRARALTADLVMEDDPATRAALYEQIGALWAEVGGYTQTARDAASHIDAAGKAALPDLREHAAADLTPALGKEVARLTTLAGEFDPLHTTSLDPGVLGVQRQFAGLAVLDDVQETLARIGSLTLLPRPDKRQIEDEGVSATDLVVSVEWEEAETPAMPSPVWLTKTDARARAVFDADVFLLAMAGEWDADATPTWRLLT